MQDYNLSQPYCNLKNGNPLITGGVGYMDALLLVAFATAIGGICRIKTDGIWQRIV